MNKKEVVELPVFLSNSDEIRSQAHEITKNYAAQRGLRHLTADLEMAIGDPDEGFQPVLIVPAISTVQDYQHGSADIPQPVKLAPGVFELVGNSFSVDRGFDFRFGEPSFSNVYELPE